MNIQAVLILGAVVLALLAWAILATRQAAKAVTARKTAESNLLKMKNNAIALVEGSENANKADKKINQIILEGRNNESIQAARRHLGNELRRIL